MTRLEAVANAMSRARCTTRARRTGTGGPLGFILCLGLLLVVCAGVQAAQDLPARAPDGSGTDLFMGGVGGVYFFPEPGELAVEIAKRDRNRRGWRTELRAILVGPDRRVLEEATIPDDGQARGSGLGPVQRCRLSARVDGRGVYGVNITVSQDRYGEEVIWSFRSNCRKYLVETARGHKDEPHQEPIVLASPDRPATVCFLPRLEAFGIDISGLPRGSAAPQMLDASGMVIASLGIDAEGQASHQFPAGVRRDRVPWQLRLPSAQGILNIDGVTRWNNRDLHPDTAYWTPDPGSWFSFPDNRWLLTPYGRTVHGQPGERRDIDLEVRNHSTREKTVQLGLEFPDGTWAADTKVDGVKCAELSAERVVVPANHTSTITVSCVLPASGQTRTVRVRATALEDSPFSTYSTLTLEAGVASATEPLAIPILLKAYRHENEQFGYAPDFPVQNQPYFDGHNRPFVFTSVGTAAWHRERWVTSPLASAVQTRPPVFEEGAFALASTKIAFDRDNHLYVLVTAGGSTALLHSTDGGQTFAAHALPGRKDHPSSFDIEQFSGHNVPEGPPPIVRYTQTARDEKLIWRRLNDLELFVPTKKDGRVVLGEPVLLSRRCIGFSAHSGIPASVVSRGSKVNVVWGEATDPKETIAGVPAYVATYDCATKELDGPVLVAHGAPPNDVHNTPSITMDRHGHLHVLAGTHGRPFPYARSLKPNEAGGGWTPPVVASQNMGQTYIGLVCGPDDTLHSAFRLWRSGVEPYPASSHATLAYQRKRPGQPWEPPRVLVVSPFSEYSVFYHRLTIDRRGRLFISYDYWSTYWFYRNDHPGRRRALLFSPDGGDTWKLAETKDLIEGSRGLR